MASGLNARILSLALLWFGLGAAWPGEASQSWEPYVSKHY